MWYAKSITWGTGLFPAAVIVSVASGGREKKSLTLKKPRTKIGKGKEQRGNEGGGKRENESEEKEKRRNKEGKEK